MRDMGVEVAVAAGGPRAAGCRSPTSSPPPPTRPTLGAAYMVLSHRRGRDDRAQDPARRQLRRGAAAPHRATAPWRWRGCTRSSRLRRRACTAPTRSSSTARCSTPSATRIRRSSSPSAGSSRPPPTAAAGACIVHGDFRLGNLMVDADGLRCGARLGAGPHRRPAGGPRLAVRQGVAVRLAASRSPASATTRSCSPPTPPSQASRVDADARALVGGARHASSGGSCASCRPSRT